MATVAGENKKEIEKNVIVTDRFNSPDQQRLDRKSKTMIKKLKNIQNY